MEEAFTCIESQPENSRDDEKVRGPDALIHDARLPQGWEDPRESSQQAGGSKEEVFDESASEGLIRGNAVGFAGLLGWSNAPLRQSHPLKKKKRGTIILTSRSVT